MKTYKCVNKDCSEYDKKVQKQSNYIYLNGSLVDVAYVCEECGQQLDVTEDLRKI